MTTFLGWLAIIAVFVILTKAYMAARRGTSRAISQAISGGKHQSGQSQVKTVTDFSVDATPSAMLEAAKRVVNAYDEAPRLAAGLYLKSERPDELVFAYGARLGDNLTMSVTAHGSEGTTLGHVRVLTWTEVNGLVNNIDQMQRVRDRVANAVREFNPDLPPPQHKI
jgi:hypothetical protein